MSRIPSKIISIVAQNWVLFSLIYFVAMVTVSTFNFPPQTFSDSASYRGADGLSNFHWISFSGDTYSRGWPIILLYSVFNTDYGRIISQTCIYFFSVNFFAFSLYRLRVKDKKYFFFAILFLIIALAKPMLLWNNYISRESLTLSLTILCSAFTVLHQTVISFKKSTILYFANVCVGSLSIIVKPTITPFILGLILLHTYFYRKDHRINQISQTSLFGIVLLALTIISYGIWNASNQNIGWSVADPTDRTLKEISYAYVISDFNPSSSGFLQELGEKNVSSCFVPVLPLNTSANLGLPMEAAAEFREQCLAFSPWVSQRFTSEYFKYLLVNPKKVFQTLEKLLPGSLAFLGEGNTSTPFPENLSNATFLNFFGVSTYSFITLLGLLLFSTYIRTRDILKLNEGFISVHVFIPFSLFISLMTSVIVSIILLPTHTWDLSRQNHTVNIFLRLIVMWQILEVIIILSRNKTKRSKIQLEQVEVS